MAPGSCRTPKRDAVGTARLEPTGKIGRVAVLPQYRGTGTGVAMIGTWWIWHGSPDSPRCI